MTTFEFEAEVPVRWRDCDAMGHVNNAVYATYLEQGRVEYLHRVVGVDIERAGLVVANLEIDFRKPIEMGELARVGVHVPSVGTSSMPIEHEVRVDGDLVAEADSRFVHVDRETGEPVPIPESWRERIDEFEGH